MFFSSFGKYFFHLFKNIRKIWLTEITGELVYSDNGMFISVRNRKLNCQTNKIILLYY